MLPIVAFSILIAFMFIGDLISTKSKSYIPSMLVFVILLVSGVWSGFIPKNIIEIPGFTKTFASYIILMFIVDMGSSITISQFKTQWKTVIVGVSAIAGIALSILTLGNFLFGWDMAVASAPPLSGGLVAMVEMSNAASAAGNDALARLVVLIYISQSIPAFFVVPYLLKKETLHQLSSYTCLEQCAVTTTNESVDAKKSARSLVALIPDKYKTSAYYLLGLAVIAVISTYIAALFNNKISPTIFALVLGLIAAEFGIIEKDSVRKSGSFGFLMFASIVASISSVVDSSPAEMLSMLIPLFGMLAIGIAGIFVGSIISGKLLGISTPLASVIGLNCLLGFPYNYILASESIKSVAKNEEESAYLTNKIMPSVLIGGFTTVTLGSVIFASILKNFL